MTAEAPGAPGIEPRWTSSAKSGVGTAFRAASRVWFSVSHGILNEVYWPRVDRACTRDLGLVVTDGREFFSEEKRHARPEIASLAPGVPGYRIVNHCLQGRYRIEKEVFTDPTRDALVQWTRFTPLVGDLRDYRIHALLAPHLCNRGRGNTAWVGEHKGVPMLFAERAGQTLALASSAGFARRSAGFVGSSDGWQDLVRNRRMTWLYERATDGNVALTGEVELAACSGEFVLVLAFGHGAAEAGHHALACLAEDHGDLRDAYVRDWGDWQRSLLDLGEPGAPGAGLYACSTAMLRVHEDNGFVGGLIASLSVPWGFAKSDDDLGGYHLVWPRDLVEAAGALIACGALAQAHRVIHYLMATQEPDGHWAQNLWLDGTPYWTGTQMDETALPILLVDLALREKAFEEAELPRLWPMVRRAAGFLARNGPVTGQDRWEEDPGYSPFTLAAEIAALVAAADLADRAGEGELATYLREKADAWNESIERWTYAEDGSLARRFGVSGYYVRIAPPETECAATVSEGFVPIKNRPPGEDGGPADQVIGVDALALVRFGLRAPDDPRILDTLRVIDALLRVDTPVGPAWRRYNGDGYGEKADGRAFDGTGVGRLWPLLTGERAHYELAAGHVPEARRLTRVLEAFATSTGLLPEQVWDGADDPDRELFAGRPSGSAMPLVWAHAEYVKLLRSLRDGRVFDTPDAALRRYGGHTPESPFTLWSFHHRCRNLEPGRTLRIELEAPARVRWSADGWSSFRDQATRDTGIGVHVADLPTRTLDPGAGVEFTFYWPEAARWEGRNQHVVVARSRSACQDQRRGAECSSE